MSCFNRGLFFLYSAIKKRFIRYWVGGQWLESLRFNVLLKGFWPKNRKIKMGKKRFWKICWNKFIPDHELNSFRFNFSQFSKSNSISVKRCRDSLKWGEKNLWKGVSCFRIMIVRINLLDPWINLCRLRALNTCFRFQILCWWIFMWFIHSDESIPSMLEFIVIFHNFYNYQL